MTTPTSTETAETSEAPLTRRQIANRRNAARSTGPKTKEGKARSRMNAIKDGLTAKVVLPDAAREEAEQRIADWIASRRPRDGVERDLVVQGANAMTLLNRCWVELETARGLAGARAEGYWDPNKEAQAAELGQQLARSPAKIAPKLKLSRHGVEWLLDRWLDLAGRLRQGADWTAAQRNIALDLLGVSEEFRDDRTPVDLPGGSPQELIAHRLAFVDARIGQLDAALGDYLNDADDVERLFAVHHTIVARDPEVQRLERYEKLLDSRVHRALQTLMRIQLEAVANAEPVPPAPTPAQAPVPAPSATPAPAVVEAQPDLEPQPDLDSQPVPTPAGGRTRDMFDAVPDLARLEMVGRLLRLDERTPFLSPEERAEGLALCETIQARVAPEPKSGPAEPS